MLETKTYKIIIPYTESASTSKKFKIEYVIEADNRLEALKKAERKFNEYSQSSSASWIRTPDYSSTRLWRIFPNDPNTPEFIDAIINKLPDIDKNKTMELLQRIEELEDTFASSKIISLTKSDDSEIVVKAINILGSFRDPTSFFAVKNAYSRENPEIKKAVVKNLIKLALPEDNILKFYKTAIQKPLTRETVFDIEDSSLIPLWLNEINNPSEFEKVKNNCTKLGKKALDILLTLDLNQPKISNYATQIVTYLKPMAVEHLWENWSEAEKKYKLYNI
jgi:hypothetical protein